MLKKRTVSGNSLILFIILFSYNTSLASSKTVSNEEINSLINSGLSNIYNFNWQSAQNTFGLIVKKYPKDPRGYLYESLINLWYYLGGKEKKYYDKFVSLSDTSINRAEDILDSNPERRDVVFSVGLAYTYRAIVFTEAENYLDAAWATKKSESYLSSLLEKDSTYYDAYLGLGIYNFAVGQVPSAFKWALRLAGIHGDESQGIKYLWVAAEKGKLTSVEAQFYLSQIYSEVLADYNFSEELLAKLTRKYPNNLLFDYSYASLEIKKRNLNNAQSMLKKILPASTKNFKQVIAYSNFLMGEILFKENNFSKATDYYLRFLSLTTKKDYKGMASYRLGICYEIDGDTSMAMNFFRQTKEGNIDLDDDIYAERKGKQFLEDGMDTMQIKLIMQENNFSAGNFKVVYDSLSKIIPLIKNNDLKAEALLYLSKANLQLKHYIETIKTAEKIDTIDVEREKWVKPYADYTIAQAYNALGNKEGYGEFLDKASDFDNYDYQSKLKNLIYASRFKNMNSLSSKP